MVSTSMMKYLYSHEHKKKMTKADAIKIQGNIASPSSPSVKFTAFDDPTKIKIDHGMKSIPK